MGGLEPGDSDAECTDASLLPGHTVAVPCVVPRGWEAILGSEASAGARLTRTAGSSEESQGWLAR